MVWAFLSAVFAGLFCVALGLSLYHDAAIDAVLSTLGILFFVYAFRSNWDDEHPKESKHA